MKRSLLFILCGVLFSFVFSSCKKDDNPTVVGPKVNFIFKFDSTQSRLNNIGQPTGVAAGNAAQSPRFNKMSAHYLELAAGALTPLGAGEIVYKAPETAIGGSTAINFSQSNFAGNNEIFLSVPLSDIAAGTYEWLRVSLAYQNYDISFRASGFNLNGTIASFIGFNTYISSFRVKDSTINVNANKLQGFWAFETSVSGFGIVQSGQAPPGATTVPNPLFATSPVPAGSCVVTGAFVSPLVITGAETADINIEVSLSTNKSFEWSNPDGNATYDPLDGDTVVDMGVRGMIPRKQ